MKRLIVGAEDKGRLLQHFIQHDYPSGFTVIDPNGCLAEAVADSTPEEHTERVFYFDPSDVQHVATFNVFEAVPKAARPKLVQDICAFFDALFPAGAETLTKQSSTFVLANTLTVLLDNEGMTFLSVLEFLSDTAFKQSCLRKCGNPIALRNWRAIEEWEPSQRRAAFAQVEAKVGTLLLSPVLHRTLQHQVSTFKPSLTPILIANLSRQTIGDTDARLLGTLLISRANTPVYINDFGFFANDYLASLFSQGSYTVALQSLSELPKTIEQIVLGFPEKYVFRTTPKDAETLQPYISGVENPKILVDLSPEEFRPPFELAPPLSAGRFRSVRKRSNASHTRKAS